MKLTEQTMKEMLKVAMGNQVRNRIDDQHGGIRIAPRGAVVTEAFIATCAPDENGGDVIIDIRDNNNIDYENDALTVRRISRRRWALILGAQQYDAGYNVEDICDIAYMDTKGRLSVVGDIPEKEFWVA